MATQLQLRRGSTAQTAIFTGAVAEVTVDTDQKTVVVHDGVTVGGTYIITKGQLDSNVSILQGINTTQNTNITAVNGFAAGAFNTANGANGLAQGAFNAANTNAGSIAVIQGIDLTQNTNITAVNNFATSAYNQANTATTTATGANGLAQGAFNQANTATTTVSQVNGYAQSAYATANVANGLAQAAFNKANTGGIFTGSVTINQDLTVSGNVNITGNVISHGANDLIINDPLIFVANNNNSNVVDIGLIGEFNNGTSQHTGIVRDATDGVWKLFSNVIPDPTTTVDFTYATWDNLRVGTLTGNVAANSITINGVAISSTPNQLVNGNRSVTLYANGIISLPEQSAFYNNTSTLVANTAAQVLDSFDATVYRTAKYIIQGLNGSDVHSTEVILTHNDTDVYISEYGTIGSNTSLYTVSGSLAAGVINLTVSPASTNTTFDFVRTSIIARELGLNLQGDLMTQSGSEDLNVGDGSEDLNA
jgi:hypothetical protein